MRGDAFLSILFFKNEENLADASIFRLLPVARVELVAVQVDPLA